MLSKSIRNFLLVGATLAAVGEVSAQIMLYEHDGFQGRSIRAVREVPNLRQFGFNDFASSIVVERGTWEVCDDAQWSGRCVVLRPGSYDSLGRIGLNDRVSSVRAVSGNNSYQGGQGAYLSGGDQYKRRRNERIYEARVTSVRAVVGAPEQRCWMEKEQVVHDNGGGANVPGAIAGAVIGGIIGHQIGGGRGQDIATAGGAVGGAALGANVGRSNGQTVVTRDVQRCAVAQQARPEYWDVTYDFKGVLHRVQMTAPPGPTIAVNREGEPRV